MCIHAHMYLETKLSYVALMTKFTILILYKNKNHIHPEILVLLEGLHTLNLMDNVYGRKLVLRFVVELRVFLTQT